MLLVPLYFVAAFAVSGFLLLFVLCILLCVVLQWALLVAAVAPVAALVTAKSVDSVVNMGIAPTYLLQPIFSSVLLLLLLLLFCSLPSATRSASLWTFCLSRICHAAAAAVDFHCPVSTRTLHLPPVAD